MSPATLAGVPELASRAVQLRPLLPSDGEWCYALMCGPAGSSWRYRGRTPSPEVVAADLWRSVFAQFVVTDRRDGRPVGLVGLYNVATEAGRAHAFAVADPSSSALVVEGFGLMCAWGFAQFSFERIFIEAPEFNVEKFASLGDAAVVEGRLRNYEFWRGRYWDLLIMSVTAESFDRRFGELLVSRRAAHLPVPVVALDHAEFREFVAQRWPLDSLGVVETLCALEELAGVAIGDEILEGVDATAPSLFADELIRRVERGDRTIGSGER